jgi:hypothetical protein
MAPGHDASPALLEEELHALGRGDGVTGLRCLSGGAIAEAWLISYADGTSVVGKTLAGAASGLFRAEADGLAALHGTGRLATPAVLAVTRRLLLEAPGHAGDDARPGWYPDNHNPAFARWWDGVQWTDHTRPF